MAQNITNKMLRYKRERERGNVQHKLKTDIKVYLHLESYLLYARISLYIQLLVFQIKFCTPQCWTINFLFKILIVVSLLLLHNYSPQLFQAALTLRA